MQVLHINSNYITSALHQTMIEYLTRQGVDNKVFAPTYDKRRAIITPKDNVLVSECFKKWDRVNFFRKQRKIISSVRDNYRIANFDCIHAYTLFTDGNVAFQLSKQYDIPYVVAIRNTDVNDFLKKMVHLRSRGVAIMERANAVFFLSPAYKKTVLYKYVPERKRKIIDAKSYVIPNGIDAFWLCNSYERITEETKDITKKKNIKCIYVGGIETNKNIELILKSLNLLNGEGWDCNLVSVGKIVENKLYNRLIKYPCFSYKAPQRKEELISSYRDADVFVMPSHTETFGLVYAEAMSQGLPVIYTRGQGFDGQFSYGEVGYSVSDNNPKELRDRIIDVMNNYAELSSNCIKCVNKFNWESIAKKYKKIYEDICEHPKSFGEIR